MSVKRIIPVLGLLVGVLIVPLAGCGRGVNAERSSAPAAATKVTAPADAPLPAEPQYREVTIPAGTRIGVRLNTSHGSRTSRVEDEVDTTLAAPVKIKGVEVVPAGSRITGHVIAAQPSGKVKGRARLALRFGTLSAHGASYPLAAQVSRIAPATKADDAEKIGFPAAGGAVVGAIVGGKKGAAIGAAAGGGAGTAVVLATPGKEVSLPKGSVLALRLQKAVTIRVPIKS